MKRPQNAAVAALVLAIATQAAPKPVHGAEDWCKVGCGATFAACLAGAVFGEFLPAEYCMGWLEGCLVGCEFEE